MLDDLSELDSEDVGHGDDVVDVRFQRRLVHGLSVEAGRAVPAESHITGF